MPIKRALLVYGLSNGLFTDNSTMRAFLPGLILLQLITAALVVAATSLEDMQLSWVLVGIGLICAVLTAFWFSAIASNLFNEELKLLLDKHAAEKTRLVKQVEQEKARVDQQKLTLQDQHARERESILLKAEQEKRRMLEESYQKIEQETRKANRRANLKVGLAFGLAATAGGVMIVSQLITLGMMVMVATGSGLTGYIIRARHERLAHKKQRLLQNLGEAPPPRLEQSE